MVFFLFSAVNGGCKEKKESLKLNQIDINGIRPVQHEHLISDPDGCLTFRTLNQLN